MNAPPRFHAVSIPTAAIACMVGWLMAGSTPALAQDTRVGQLRIVDAQGLVRGYFGVDASGRDVSLSLLDNEGKTRLKLGFDATGDAASFRVIDSSGRERQVLLQPSDILARARNPGGKPDDVSPQIIRNMQTQIDDLRSALNRVIDQMNRPR